MTNLEKYKDEILKILEEDNFAVVNNKPCYCDKTECEDCYMFDNETPCGRMRFIWGFQEYSELPKLTDREHAFCKAVQTGCIARENDGTLCYFRRRPEKCEYGWDYSDEGNDYVGMNLFKLDFSFITEEKLWSIEELLNLEVE